jgi:hypothetical protein
MKWWEIVLAWMVLGGLMFGMFFGLGLLAGGAP